MLIDKSERLNTIKSLFPFSLLVDDEIKRIAPFFEQVNFPEGATIFSDGYPAKDLYFILSGSVKIIYHHKEQDAVLGVLSAGDHLGEEAFSANSIYKTRAVCLSNVTALRIKGGKARSIAEAQPQIRNAFWLFQKTFHLACSTRLPWRSETEGIELFSRRHTFFLFLRLVLIGSASLAVFSFILFSALASTHYFTSLLILSLIVLMLGCGLCAWSALEWTNDYFIVTHERVSVQKKLIGFYENRHESPINAILSVGIDTSFWGRLLGYGTVTLRTYTGDLRFERLPFPYLIYELLEIRRQYAVLQASQTEKREVREALSGKTDQNLTLKSMRAKSAANTANDQIYQSDSLSDLLARFFNLRTQKEESVEYRTHWWILFRKTLLPALFLIAIILVVLARLIGFLAQVPEVVIYAGGVILSLIGWGWWAYQYQDWHNDIYILTDDQLIDVSRKPLGNEDRKSAPVKNIQTVEYERKGIINLLLNFGTVKIKIGNEELTFDNVYQPSVVQGEIYARYRNFLETAKKNEQQRFVEWITTYDEMKKEKENTNHKPDQDENG
jgi:CRP-like cAMP-binding protein